MDAVEEHIRQANLIFKHIYEDDYRPLYFQTNEKLRSIFRSVSVQDKDVLTVLSSGDHLFSSYYCGAKRVDAFDVNELTFYLYYLRYFSLFELNTLDISCCNNLTLQKVLCSSGTTMDEEKAKYFWNTLLECDSNIIGSNLFYPTYLDYYESNVPIDDYFKLQDVMRNKPFTFSKQNVFESMNIDCQYHVIFLSNVLEFCNRVEQLYVVRDNMNHLLHEDGIVVTTNLMRTGVSEDSLERKIMGDKFLFCSGISEYNTTYGIDMPVFNIYQKKKC